MIHRTLLVVGVLTILALTSPAQSQSGAARPQFEVASVRPSAPQPGGASPRSGGGGGPVCRARFTVEGGRLTLACLTVTALIGHAFGILPDRIIGPAWLAAPEASKFDIAAKLPAGASESQVPQMLQDLLADRFQLLVHRENQERTVYGLVVAKSGLTAKMAAPDADALAPTAGTFSNIGGSQNRGTMRRTMSPNDVQRLEAFNTTFEELAGLLSSLMVGPVPIVDMTGLPGRYQLTLDVSWREVSLSARQARGDGPVLDPADDPAVTAAQLSDFRHGLQRYGLQLEARKRPAEIIVVDRLEKTPTEN